MDKYSIKINNFINSKSYIIKRIQISDNNNVIISINDIIKSTYSNDYDVVIKQDKIKKMHDINDYPFIYLFFSKLYENELIKFNSEFNSAIKDFSKFTKWYRKNHHSIELDDIHDIMSSYIKTNNSNNSNIDDELIQIYNIMFDKSNEMTQILYANKFIPLDVQHNIESFDWIKYSIEHKDFNINIYDNDKNKDNINNVINKMIHIIYIMKKISTNNKSPFITIILASQRKELPSNSTNDIILCPDNINSGCSMTGINIMIWRAEEVYKILIHELIHFYGIDFHSHSHAKNNDYTQLNNYIMDTYNVRYVDCPNESYTEFFAVIIHSVFVSYYLKISFNEVINKELFFTLFQICKILSYYGITEIAQLGSKMITQTTSVFSYFVIKGALLFNTNKVFEFINNDIYNIKITDRIAEYHKLIKKSMTTEFLEQINYFLKNCKYNDDRFIMKTMRMTCFQLK